MNWFKVLRFTFDLAMVVYWAYKIAEAVVRNKEYKQYMVDKLTAIESELKNRSDK